MPSTNELSYLWLMMLPVDQPELRYKINDHIALLIDDLENRGDVYPYGPPAIVSHISPPIWEVTVAIWNIRDIPNMIGSKVLGQLKLGQRVNQLSVSADGLWVQHDGGDTKIAGWSAARGMKKL